MAEKTGWHCTYYPPNRGRRPFTPEKLRGIVALVCEEQGFWVTAEACAGGLWDCADPPEQVCKTVAGMIEAADLVRELVEDWDAVLDALLTIAKAGGIITVKAAIAIEAAVKVLGSHATADTLRDAHEWLDCGPFDTGGGF
jgi:hypothetical protein